MKWFRQWLRRTLKKAVDEENQENCGKEPPMMLGKCTVEEEMGDKKLTFNLYFAEGGVILQQYHYDHQKDRSFKKLLLIPDDQDVAERVGQHVAMEIMRL